MALNQFFSGVRAAAQPAVVFSQQQIIPALGSAVKIADNFRKDTLSPAFETINELTQENVAPYIEVTMTAVDDFDKKTLRPALGNALGPALDQMGIREEVEEFSGKAADWVKENPGSAAMIVTGFFPSFVPGVVSAPFLWALGYGGNGVRAASIASELQSKVGIVGAKSAFAYLQSAGMNGYGAAAVNGVSETATVMTVNENIPDNDSRIRRTFTSVAGKTTEMIIEIANSVKDAGETFMAKIISFMVKAINSVKYLYTMNIPPAFKTAKNEIMQWMWAMANHRQHARLASRSLSLDAPLLPPPHLSLLQYQCAASQSNLDLAALTSILAMGFGEFFANTGAALDKFGKEQLGPAIGEAMKNADEFGKTKLGPALEGLAKNADEFGKNALAPAIGEAVKAADEFGKTKLGPALEGLAKNADEFGKNTLAPAIGEVVKNADEFGKTKLGPALADLAKNADEFGKNTLGPAVGEIVKGADQFGRDAGEFGKTKVVPALDKFGKDSGRWIKEHPEETAMIATSAATLLFPGIVTNPFLGSIGMFGFGRRGIASASVASKTQSKIGNVGGGSAFAVLQSAGMGGYGIGVLNGIIRFGAVALGTAGAVLAVSR
ncbi:hypothetical protein G7Y89_g15183 [Cudoniella acicularis]|uniref:Uncharacterized protein n=1 Tax=Cudoniella acicularis TaxID=354080 RepID=A0A8H4QS72_9HELO|nr:hypothetical protein G7Y89_g15183 [Cudoniella acicularis]